MNKEEKGKRGPARLPNPSDLNDVADALLKAEGYIEEDPELIDKPPAHQTPPPFPVNPNFGFVPSDLYESAPDETIEKLCAAILGDELYERLQNLALGHGLTRVTPFLKQRLYAAMQEGGFSIPNDLLEKRTGNDEHFAHPDNVRLITIIGQSNFQHLLFFAREKQCSNKAALIAGIAHALDGGNL